MGCNHVLEIKHYFTTTSVHRFWGSLTQILVRIEVLIKVFLKKSNYRLEKKSSHYC